MLFDLTFMPKYGGSLGQKLSPSIETSKLSAATSPTDPFPQDFRQPSSSRQTHLTTRGRSSSIPLPSSHVARTESELQLSLDQEAAERRDHEMFYRMINGIRERHVSDDHMAVSERSIASIIQTRMRMIEDSTQDVSPDYCEGNVHQADQPSNGTYLETTDEWSISGFEVEHSTQATAQGEADALDHQDPGSMVDEEIFDIDL